MMKSANLILAGTLLLVLASCQTQNKKEEVDSNSIPQEIGDGLVVDNEPLVTEIFTADPSAHVFEGEIHQTP